MTLETTRSTDKQPMRVKRVQTPGFLLNCCNYKRRLKLYNNYTSVGGAGECLGKRFSLWFLPQPKHMQLVVILNYS